MPSIPLSDLGTIEARIAKVNARADKLGVDGISLEVSDPEVRVETDADGVETITHWVDVTVVGPQVKLAGWVFLATIDHSEGLVRTSPTHEVDGIRAFADEAKCDHCGFTRDRNRTFVLAREEDLDVRTQVGSTCIKDFLGHEVSLWVFEASSDLAADLSAWDGSGGPTGYSLGSFLNVVAGVIRENGWVSRGVSREFDKPATADLAQQFIHARRDDVRDSILPGGVTEDDREVARRAVEWAESLEDVDNDYLFNVRTVADNGVVTHKSAGIAASIISAHARAEERRITREREQAERNPVPVTDERITVEGIITKVAYKDTAYGTRQVITVRAAQGFILWGTAPKPLRNAKAGDTVRFDCGVEVSDRDETFGFFSRPTKAAVLEEATA